MKHKPKEFRNEKLDAKLQAADELAGMFEWHGEVNEDGYIDKRLVAEEVDDLGGGKI